MGKIKQMGSKLINSPIGAAGGGLAGYWAGKKYLHVEKWYTKTACVIVGALIGASIEYGVKAHFVKPAAAAKGK